MSERLRMLGVFGAGFALGVILAWTAPPAPDGGDAGPPKGAGSLPPFNGDGAPPPPTGAAGPGPGGSDGPPPAIAGGPPPLEAGASPTDGRPPPGAVAPTVDADGNPIGPPPPEGAGPPDGALAPPLDGDHPPPKPGAEPVGGAQPPGGAKGPAGTDWIETHLQGARALWQAEAEVLAADHPALAERARLLAASVPEAGGRPPPLPEVVILLNRELELLDAIRDAGAVATRIEADLATLLAQR